MDEMNSTELVAVERSPMSLMDMLADDKFLGRLAKISNSSLIPQSYKGKIEDVLIATDMANRMNMPLMSVLQNMYVVQGKPSWSGKYCIALINTCGLFDRAHFRWLQDDKGKVIGCQCWAKDKMTGELLEGTPITDSMVKQFGWDTKSGSMWSKDTMRAQMFCYRAAEYFLNVYAPELTMGVYTVESRADIDGYTPEYNDIIEGDK